MLNRLKRCLIGFSTGSFAGGVLGTFAGFGIAMANFIAHPPHGEDFSFAFTSAAYAVIGAIAGAWTGLAAGLINRRWVGVGVGAIVGFISGLTWYAPTLWTLSAALSLAIPSSLVGAVTGIVVFQFIAPIENKH